MFNKFSSLRVLVCVFLITGILFMSSCYIPGTSDISGSGDNTSENITPDSSQLIIDETTTNIEDTTAFSHIDFVIDNINEGLLKLSIDMINTENITKETANISLSRFYLCFEDEYVWISTYEQMLAVNEQCRTWESIDTGIIAPAKDNDENVKYYKFYLFTPPKLISQVYTTAFMRAVPVDAQGNPV